MPQLFGVRKVMDGLSSEVAIDEFLKQGVHNRVARRSAWSIGSLLTTAGEEVFRLDSDGVMTELTNEDLSATDWTLNEHEFL